MSLLFHCHLLTITKIAYYAVLWNSLLSAVRQATFLTNFQRLLINSDTAFMKNKLYFSFIFQVSNIFRSEMLNLYK